MTVHDRFHLGREDAITGSLDHVLLALLDHEVALVVYAPDVARVEPAVANRLRGRVRSPPVALHDHRAADHDLARFARLELGPAVVEAHDLRVHERERHPHRPVLRPVGRADVGRRGRLAEPVALDQRVTGQRLPASRDLGRHRRAPREARPQRGEVVFGRPGPVDDGHVDRGDEGGERAAVPPDRVETRGELESAERDQAGTDVRHHVQLAFHPGNVEPRQHAEGHVGLGEADVEALELAVRDDVAVGDLGAFRDSGGSRRVLEERGVAGRAGGGRNQRRRPPCDHGKILGPGARPRRLEEGGRDGERRRRRQEVAVCRDGDRLQACPVADGRDHRPPLVGGDEGARPRVLELVEELGRLVHGVEADVHGPRLERSEVCDRELGAVLEKDRHAVARV